MQFCKLIKTRNKHSFLFVEQEGIMQAMFPDVDLLFVLRASKIAAETLLIHFLLVFVSTAYTIN